MSNAASLLKSRDGIMSPFSRLHDARRSATCRGLIERLIRRKVVRVALENAASVAGTLLFAEATMTEVEESKSERQAPLEAA
jgi:hypothetical protein